MGWAMALVIFLFVIHSSVHTLKTTVQGHTATLGKPVLEAAVFPGVPAALAEGHTCYPRNENFPSATVS